MRNIAPTPKEFSMRSNGRAFRYVLPGRTVAKFQC
jgi:hypothetical protein